MKIIIFVLFIAQLSAGYEGFSNIHFRRKNLKIQEEAVQKLVERVLPKHFQNFKISVVPSTKNDTFQILSTGNGTVYINGNSGVDVASSLNYYLKYYCDSQISWQNQQIKLPTQLPKVNVTISFNDRLRYYQNICTSSYSFVWWNWQQWEKHIDWIALNGFNLVLTPNGQEIVWKQLYRNLGMTQQEIDEHFTGPAFLAWNRMGNLRKWGGPLSASWHNRSYVLQKKILKRMRSLGIVPVLPGFAGHVPRAFRRLFPNANMTKMSEWSKFNESYCCPYLLDPEDAIFIDIGTKYYTELNKIYGDDDGEVIGRHTIYSADIFNEMIPTSDNLTYLNLVGHTVYSTMQTFDPNAIWLMQGWLFYNDPFWTKERAKALITSVPQGKMIILDLQSEQFPQYDRLDSYFGQPYIWCMLHNFGGTLGMFGSAEVINKEPFRARQNTTMVGIGLTPEGINQNYVIYDLMIEMAWRKEPVDLTEWFGNYSRRRYGEDNMSTNEAWQLLKNTVYNFSGTLRIRGKYSINSRPTLNIKQWSWYNTSDLFRAFVIFLDATQVFPEVETYRYDLVDLTRQVLQRLGDIYHKKLVQSYRKRDVDEFMLSKKAMLELLADLDLILKTNENFLFGKWLEDARMAASSSDEKIQYERNARNQITLWGPNGEIRDYANKQWAGIVADYFKPRWEIFLNALEDSLLKGIKFNETEVNENIFVKVEQPFTFSTKNYTYRSQGDSIDIARYIRDKWTIQSFSNLEKKEGNIDSQGLFILEFEKDYPEIVLVNRRLKKRKIHKSLLKKKKDVN